MAGGIWTGQNKIRPGACIHFKSVEKPGTREVAMMPVPNSQLPFGVRILDEPKDT